MSERLYLGPVYYGPIWATSLGIGDAPMEQSQWHLAVWPATTVEAPDPPGPDLGGSGWETLLAPAPAPVARVLSSRRVVSDCAVEQIVKAEALRDPWPACAILDRIEEHGAPAALVYGVRQTDGLPTVLQSFGPVIDSDVDRFLRVIGLG